MSQPQGCLIIKIRYAPDQVSNTLYQLWNDVADTKDQTTKYDQIGTENGKPGFQFGSFYLEQIPENMGI